MLFAKSRKALVAVIAIASIMVGLLPYPLGAQATKKVAEVAITGNTNVNKEAIAGEVGLKAGEDYSEKAVEDDKAKIMALGYFSAVSSRTEETPGGVKVIYDVVENPVVKDIKIVGNDPVDVEKIKAVLRTKPDRVLNTATLNLDIEAIQQLYKDEGYVGTYVTEDIGIDRDTGILTIPILVPVVESIDIVGNKKTGEAIFLREMKTKPGDIFNIKVLKDDMARIYNLDILEDIQAPQLETGSEVGKVRIAMPVTEKKTGSVSLGLGYSSRSKLVGRAELTESNFRGQAQGLNLMWETGVSGGSSGRSSYELGFHEPWLDKHHTSFSVNVFNKYVYRFASGVFGSGGSDDDQYYERRRGGSMSVSRPFTDRTRGFVTLRTEKIGINEDAIEQLFGNDSDNNIGSFFSGDIQSGAFKMVNNTRDVDINPANGGYHSVSFELGRADGNNFTKGDPIFDLTNPEDPILIGFDAVPVPLEGNFSKVSTDLRRYFSKGGLRENITDKRRVLAVRVQAGLAGGALPFPEQFFIGGSDSLRGYREDRFWGDKMVSASAEYRVPVANSLTGVAFLDAGDAWGSDAQELNGLVQHESFSPSVGAGVGIRVNTPIGNLRLDYGIGDEGARTHFSMGHAF